MLAVPAALPTNNNFVLFVIQLHFFSKLKSRASKERWTNIKFEQGTNEAEDL